MNKYTYIHIDNETLISGWLGLSVFHLPGKQHYKSLVAHKKLKLMCLCKICHCETTVV